MNTNNNNGILIGILILLVFGVGFVLGRFSTVSDTFITGTMSTERGEVSENKSAANGSQAGGTTISASQLTDGQKKMLAAMGIDASTFTITPAMIACAEASIGATRVEEIKNGAMPSFSEGAKLAACYKK